MSKQNKVNPGMYTQRGRLTQDDVARELKKGLMAAGAAGKRGSAAAKTPKKTQPAARKAKTRG